MDQYEVLCALGKGSFGQVSKIRRKADGRQLVWKQICYSKMSEREKQQLVSQVNILSKLRHPNIVSYQNRVIDKKQGKIYIVMQFCAGGDLRQLIRKCQQKKDFIAQEMIWKTFAQVVMALAACHRREDGKILHRDIKAGNIFLDSSMNVKLGDFGLSRIMSQESVYACTHVGTPYYMSPQQVRNCKYNEKSDIWSTGCLIYQMASLQPPFHARSHAELAAMILQGRVQRIPSRYSNQLSQVIQEMMTVDQRRRPSVDQLLQIPRIAQFQRENLVRDDYGRLKRLEEILKRKEQAALKKKQELKKREQNIEARQRKIRTFEKVINQGYQKAKRDQSLIQKIDMIKKEFGDFRKQKQTEALRENPLLVNAGNQLQTRLARPNPLLKDPVEPEYRRNSPILNYQAGYRRNSPVYSRQTQPKADILPSRQVPPRPYTRDPRLEKPSSHPKTYQIPQRNSDLIPSRNSPTIKIDTPTNYYTRNSPSSKTDLINYRKGVQKSRKTYESPHTRNSRRPQEPSPNRRNYQPSPNSRVSRNSPRRPYEFSPQRRNFQVSPSSRIRDSPKQEPSRKAYQGSPVTRYSPRPQTSKPELRTEKPPQNLSRAQTFDNIWKYYGEHKRPSPAQPHRRRSSKESPKPPRKTPIRR